MSTKNLSIRQSVQKLNNETDDGGFWLPNIQRSFIWSEEQICRLFDSILREYPISTLLVWRTNKEIRHRKFIQTLENHYDKSLNNLFVPSNSKTKSLVLDGQQRLQSLYIGLRGSYEGKELYINILSGELSAPDDIKFQFRFIENAAARFPFIRFRDIVDSDESTRILRQKYIEHSELSDRTLTDSDKDKIEDNIDRIKRVFTNGEVIVYQELDAIDKPNLYNIDEVVEIFIRANSGGTKLSKSDLLFSLLVSDWDDAIKGIEEILDTINGINYKFDRDFILKVCLTLLDEKASYRVEKFRKPGVVEAIQEKWVSISRAVKQVVDYLSNKTFIRCAETLPSDQVLIPLINLCYRFPDEWRQAGQSQTAEINNYLNRILLTGALSKSHADLIIDRMVDSMKAEQRFIPEKMFEAVRSDGLSLEITEEQLWSMGYGSSGIHLLFNLWYDFNYRPTFSGNKPQVDHIFPQSILKTIKKENPRTGRKDLLKYQAPDRNQLANCMLLTADENGAGGKTDTLPEDWFADKDEMYLERHLIPRNKELWKLDNFEKFIDERKKLIRQKFADLLIQK